jgi:hypothetical protein
MRDKLFPLSRTQREDMWRRFKQTDHRRVAERLHALLLLNSGQNVQAVSTMLLVPPKTLNGRSHINVVCSPRELNTSEIGTIALES